MKKILKSLYKFIKTISKFVGLSYQETDILLYYFILPLSWTVLFDIWLELPITTSILLLVWLNIFLTQRKHFAAWSENIYAASVKFLESLKKIKLKYATARILTGLIFPLFLFFFLLILAFT